MLLANKFAARLCSPPPKFMSTAGSASLTQQDAAVGMFEVDVDLGIDVDAGPPSLREHVQPQRLRLASPGPPTRRALPGAPRHRTAPAAASAQPPHAGYSRGTARPRDQHHSRRPLPRKQRPARHPLHAVATATQAACPGRLRPSKCGGNGGEVARRWRSGRGRRQGVGAVPKYTHPVGFYRSQIFTLGRVLSFPNMHTR